MFNLFHPDSKTMRFGMKFANLMWLHILTAIACLPIITAGAAFTAMHKILLQIYRDEESALTKSFFITFRENFRQATILWLIYLLLLAGFVFDYWLILTAKNEFLNILLYILPVALLLWGFTLSWVFVLQSRYRNTVFGTIKLAFVLSISRPFQSFTMTVLMAAPIWLCLIAIELVPLVAFLGFTLPGILRAMLYSRTFDELENTDWRKAKQEESNKIHS